MTSNLHHPRLISIVGSGRSGTTALAQAIASLPNVAFTPELRFFTHAMSSRRRFEPYGSQERALAFLRHAGDKITKFNPEYGPVVAALEEAAASRLPGLAGGPPWRPIDVYRFVFREFLAGITDGQPVVVLHTPADMFFVSLIDAVAGSAKYIFTYRDPRGFVASAMRGNTRWFRNDLHAIAYWNLSMAAGEKLAVDHDTTFVRQEELLTNPRAVLAHLESQLALPGLSSANVEFVNSSFDAPPSTASIADRYRDVLTPREAATTAFLTRGRMARYYAVGSAESQPAGTAAHRSWLRIRHAVAYRRLRALNHMRERGWAGAYFSARQVAHRVLPRLG